MDYTIEYISPIGKIILASDGMALTGLWFLGQKHFGANIQQPVLDGSYLPVLRQAIQWLDAYWWGKNPSPTALPLAPRGTEFQKKVWHLLLKTSYGDRLTYGELAKQYAVHERIPSMSAQAIGNAVGRNPISIIIPCHRVVGASGSMTGYAGGVARKAALLQHEAAIIAVSTALTDSR